MKGHSFEVKIQLFLRQPGVVAPSKSLAGRRREQAGYAGLQSNDDGTPIGLESPCSTY